MTRPRCTASAFAVGLFLALGGTSVAGQTSKLQGPPTSVPESIVEDLVEVRDKFVALADAMPPDVLRR